MLEPGQSQQELSGAAGSEQYFAMLVPANQASLTFTLTNAAQADLYVRFGGQPTTTRYDCSSRTTGATDECRITSPAEGMWFVTVRGVAAYTGVSLTGYATPIPEAALVSLSSGQPVTGLSVPAAGVRFFSLDVPAGQSRVAFTLTGGTGEAVLLGGYGGKPWPSTAQCTSELRGVSASCVFNAPRAGTWFVALQARTALSGFTLVGTHTAVGDGAPSTLTSGEWVQGLSGTPVQDALFRIDVPDNQLRLVVELAGGADSAEFFLSGGIKPTASDFGCAGTTSRSCTVERPQAGPWFVRLRGVSNYSGLGLRATLTAPVALSLGVPLTGISGQPGETRYFRFEVPPGTPGLRWRITWDSNSRILAGLKFGDVLQGSTNSVPCRDRANCVVAHPTAGSWFGSVYFSENMSEVEVLAELEQGPVASLQDNVPLEVSAPAGSFRYYTFDVAPETEQLRFELFSSTQATLYVQRGREPGIADSLCRDWTSPSTPHATCTIQFPEAGTWHVLIEAEDALEGALRATTSSVPRIANGFPELLPAGAQNSEKLWILEVPEGRSDLLIRLADSKETSYPVASGDTALLVKRGGVPNSVDHDCKSDNPSSFTETCVFTNPLPGTWYILVRGKLPYIGVRLEATHSGTPAEGVDALANGVTLLDLSDWRHAYRLWRLDVPEGQRRLEFDISGGAGSVDMAVQYGTRPTDTHYACHAAPSSVGQRCVIDQPRAGTWFVLARGVSDFEGVYLTARYSNDGELLPMTAHIPLPNLAGDEPIQRLFKLEVPSGRSQLRVHLSGTLYDVTMCVKHDAVPLLTDTLACDYDNSGSVLDHILPAPAAGTYYVLLTGKYREAALTGMDQLSTAVAPIEPLLNGAPTWLAPSSSPTRRYFMVYVPPGTFALKVKMEGHPNDSSQDPELYVRHGTVPTLGVYDCLSRAYGSNESCSFQNPQEGLWYIVVEKAIPYNLVSLRADHD
ncbi:PPC domain-containing protein [Pyxidicoccus sp. 3LG]